MKKLFTFLFLILFFESGIAQDIVRFKANETADVILGKEWNYNYEEMKKPLNIDFDGKRLKLFYDSGTIYLELPVISYEKKEKSDYDKKTGELFALKVEREDVIQYIIIERTLVYEKWINTIKIPYYSKKELFQYTYYQFFEE